MDIGALGAAVSTAITQVDNFVWGVPMLVILVGSHLYLTVRTGFIQRKLPTAIKLSVAKDPDAEGDISQFGALTTALSATIGTGNIVGVATAILAGGPGAVLWMWLTGVFGIATKYAETLISVKYRVRDHNNEMLGGAMYAWQRAFEKNGKTPWWAMLGAVLFALFAAIAAFGIGSAVQASALTDVVTSNLPMFDVTLTNVVVGLVIVVLVSLVIFGGVKVIANVCEKLVPVMAIAYALGCIIILFINWAYIWPAVCMICECAFTAQAAFGGAVGFGVMKAMQFGAARGLFSNESGLGSAPIVASAAATRNPARQALVSMTGTFWDTVVICLLTGLVLVSTMIAYPDIMASGAVQKGADLTSAAFASIPFIGTPVLVIGMVLFSYSTILGWSYYGNRCVTYLFGKRAIRPYQVIYVAVAFLGAIGVGDLVWTISDITNALMAIPNIVVVLALSGLIARETKHYVWDGNLMERDETPIPTYGSK